MKFHSTSGKEEHVQSFSSTNWEALSQSEKSHSLSNCVACATQFRQLRKTFQLKLLFCLKKRTYHLEELMLLPTRQLTCLVLCLQLTSLLLKCINRDTKMKCIRETQAKCVSERSSQLDSSALQADYGTDLSMNKYEKISDVTVLTSI